VTGSGDDFGDSTEDASAKRLTKLVGRDGIEPPTPGFSDLSLGIVKDAKVLIFYAVFGSTSLIPNVLECS